MARTLTEIVQAIRANWVENITLQEIYTLDVTKTFDEQFSKVSIEAIITYVVGYAIWLYESLVYAKADEITATIALQHEFSIPWYTALALSFQLGDLLEYNETSYRHSYPVIDESKQIIKHISIRQRQIEGVTKLQVFATKENRLALTSDEIAAFSDYMTQIGAAGTHFQFISLAPDELIINADVYYNPQVLRADGTTLADGILSVEAAIIDYLNNIKYGGVFNRTKQTDAIQAALGVNDVVLGNVLMNGDLMAAREFESPSGFFTAITMNITYTPGYAG